MTSAPRVPEADGAENGHLFSRAKRLGDDEQVRQVAGEILRLQGYRVLAAATPREALEQSAELGGHIDVLRLLDAPQ